MTVTGQFFHHSAFTIPHSPLRRALTLVELLIVIIVIGILISSILVASAGFINKGRSNNTQALLQVVSDAVEEFKREQTAKPTISRAKQPKATSVGDSTKPQVFYSDRYGAYPPDELEVFTASGLPGSSAPRTLAPGAAVVITGVTSPPSWGALRFYRDGTPADDVEYRDQVAMIVAIETLSETASVILDRIPDRNRSVGNPQANGNPALFLDRPAATTGTPNGAWDPADHQIRYIIDDWGSHISYLAQRDWKEEPGYVPIASTNHAGWNEASTELIRMNGGQPIIMSYGPNGKDQLSYTAMHSNADASLVGDFEPQTPSAEDAPHVIDNPANADNLYSNPALKEKLAKGVAP